MVLDTGSVDRTRAIAAAAGARVETFAWCDDFAAARNAAIEAARCDWILMLDADERLAPESGPRLRRAAERLPAAAHAYRVRIENRALDGLQEVSSTHAIPRFFPRRPELRFVGAIHEDLALHGDPARTCTVEAPGVLILHFGYDDRVVQQRGKIARNLTLLERELERSPDDARPLFYRGRLYFQAGRYAEAAADMERFVDRCEGLPRHFLVEGYRAWMAALLELGDVARLDEVAYRAERDDALSCEALGLLAAHEERRGRLAEAERYLLVALENRSSEGPYHLPGAGSWRTRLQLAHVYEVAGDVPRALEQLAPAFEQAPPGVRHKAALTALLLAVRADDPAPARHWRRLATETTPDEEVVQGELFELSRAIPAADDAEVEGDPSAALDRACGAGDWQRAYDAATSLPLDGSAGLVRVLFVATKLHEDGAPEAALDLLERLVDAYPPRPDVYWLLVQALKQVGRYEDALAALEIVRQLPDPAAEPRAA